jgi:hypothetical protein
MHIHFQPINLSAMTMHLPTTVAAQQAADTRRRLAKAASMLSEDSDPFESFMIGNAADGAPRRERNQGSPSRANRFHSDNDQAIGRNLSVSA